MNKIFNFIKNIFYAIPFGLKAADTEIMSSNQSVDGNDVVVKQQISDKRVAKHLLKGEVTKEVDELRYRTYKVNKESKQYNYIGNGVAVKKENVNKGKTIKFSQENKLICNDILTELKHVNGYGVEEYNINIYYNSPVRFKMQEFLTVVDVIIEENKKALTTLRFSDIRNPQSFKSKPFVGELEKLHNLFENNDAYGLSKNELASSILCMNFTTFNATDSQPDVVSYSFIRPELIDVKHENGEFKLTYSWAEHSIIDLAEKFFNKELEEKYKNKEKKDSITINDLKVNKIIKCSKCGKEINTAEEGFITDSDTAEPICIECFKKSLY